MTTQEKSAGKQKPAPTPSEAEKAFYSLLTAKPTPEERRKAVRLLLRRASQSLERSA